MKVLIVPRLTFACVPFCSDQNSPLMMFCIHVQYQFDGKVYVGWQVYDAVQVTSLSVLAL